MREILFRSKRKDNGEWVIGCLVYDSQHTCIRDFGYEYFEVDPETVCEYTGLTDKNGKKIFEGDIVKLAPPDEDFSLHNPKEERILEVVFFEGMFAVDMHRWWKYGHGRCALEGYEAERLEVIGNIHDNPDLITIKPLEEE